MNPSEYELIVQGLVELLLRADLVVPASVQHLAKLTGSSGQEYEIDLSYRFSIAGVDYLTIVECKHWNKRVGRDVVAAFKTVVADLGAHKGIVVSTKGFQKGAIGLAADRGIALLKISDTKNPELHQIVRLTGPWPDIVRYLETESPVFTSGAFEEIVGFCRCKYSVDSFFIGRYGREALVLLKGCMGVEDQAGDLDAVDMDIAVAQLLEVHDEWLDEYQALEGCCLPIWSEPSIPVRQLVTAIRETKEELGLPVEKLFDFEKVGLDKVIADYRRRTQRLESDG